MISRPVQTEPPKVASKAAGQQLDAWRISRRNFSAAAGMLAIAMTAGIGSAIAGRGRGRGGGGRGGGGGGGGVSCFLAPTRILTPSGQVEVYKLRIGDLVITHSGAAKPIRQIKVTVFSRFENNRWPSDVLPIRVERGALDNATPHSDLYLSRAHSLLLDGVLIPVGDLVNGKTINMMEPPGLDRLEYFHLELPEHDVVIAEGALCELFLDREALLTGLVPYAPLLRINGGRSQLKSRLRSAISPIVDVRNQQDIIRDRLENRAEMPRAA